MKPFPQIVIPEFDKEDFNRTPNSPVCKAIETTRLLVEILGWLQSAQWEFNESEYSSKIQLDGDYALVVRYKREKDNKYHPACALSFDQDNAGNICINQVQWSKDKHSAFRFHSSFNHLEFYIQLIEETFIKNGIYVSVKDLPDGIEWASYSSKAHRSYEILQTAIIGLNSKYGVTPAKTKKEI